MNETKDDLELEQERYELFAGRLCFHQSPVSESVQRRSR